MGPVFGEEEVVVKSEEAGWEWCRFMSSPLQDKTKAFALQIIKDWLFFIPQKNGHSFRRH